MLRQDEHEKSVITLGVMQATSYISRNKKKIGEEGKI